MEAQVFLNEMYPQSKGRIDDQCNLTWNQVMSLMEDYHSKIEEAIYRI